MSKLVTAEKFYQYAAGVPVSLWANIQFPDQNRTEPQGETDKPAALAFVNEGRWMVKCPFGCGSAQVASETDHRFFCASSSGCQNYSVHGKLIPTMWPTLEMQEAIESILEERPPVFRNWIPGETLKQLRLENEVRGNVV